MRCYPPAPDIRFYAGIDRHARSLFLVVLDRDGQTRFGRILAALPQSRSPQECWVRLVFGLGGQELCRSPNAKLGRRGCALGTAALPGIESRRQEKAGGSVPWGK